MIFWYRRALRRRSYFASFVLSRRQSLAIDRPSQLNCVVADTRAPFASRESSSYHRLKANLRKDSQRIGTNIAPISAIKKLSRFKEIVDVYLFPQIFAADTFNFFDSISSGILLLLITIMDLNLYQIIFFNSFLIILMYIY